MAETQATTQLYHDSEEMAADSSKSSKLLLYQSAFFHLRLMLEAEVGTVSTVAFQEGLIELELYTAVVEQKMYVTSQSQMMLLLTTLCKKMKDHPAEAKGIVEKFLQIMESEAAYDHLRMRLRNALRTQKGKTPHYTVFQRNIVAICGVLHGGLSSVATQCHTKGLIPMQLMSRLTNASAGHAQNYIDQVLQEIEKKINEAPENLELFITSVLEPMGKYAECMINKLRGKTADEEDDMEVDLTAPDDVN